MIGENQRFPHTLAVPLILLVQTDPASKIERLFILFGGYFKSFILIISVGNNSFNTYSLVSDNVFFDDLFEL